MADAGLSTCRCARDRRRRDRLPILQQVSRRSAMPTSAPAGPEPGRDIRPYARAMPRAVARRSGPTSARRRGVETPGGGPPRRMWCRAGYRVNRPPGGQGFRHRRTATELVGSPRTRRSRERSDRMEGHAPEARHMFVPGGSGGGVIDTWHKRGIARDGQRTTSREGRLRDEQTSAPCSRRQPPIIEGRAALSNPPQTAVRIWETPAVAFGWRQVPGEVRRAGTAHKTPRARPALLASAAIQ